MKPVWISLGEPLTATSRRLETRKHWFQRQQLKQLRKQLAESEVRHQQAMEESRRRLRQFESQTDALVQHIKQGFA